MPSRWSTRRRARLLGSVPVDSRPAAIAYGAGSIWVASPDARSVARISPSSRRVVASVLLDRPAQGLAATKRSLWAVGSSRGDSSLTLDRIDPTFDTAARVRRLPMVVAGDSGSITAGRNSVVVAPRAGYLTRIDARSGRTLQPDRPERSRRLRSRRASAARGSPTARRTSSSASMRPVPSPRSRSDAGRRR